MGRLFYYNSLLSDLNKQGGIVFTTKYSIVYLINYNSIKLKFTENLFIKNNKISRHFEILDCKITMIFYLLKNININKSISNFSKIYQFSIYLNFSLKKYSGQRENKPFSYVGLCFFFFFFADNNNHPIHEIRKFNDMRFFTRTLYLFREY